MLKVEELDAILGRKRLSRSKVAKICGVTPKTYHSWDAKKENAH